MSTRAPGLVCTITPGDGRSDSIRMTAAATRSAPKRAAQHVEVLEPVEQRDHQPGRGRHALQRLGQPGRLGGHEQHVDRLGELGHDRRVGGEVRAERAAGHGEPRLAQHAAVSGAPPPRVGA